MTSKKLKQNIKKSTNGATKTKHSQNSFRVLNAQRIWHICFHSFLLHLHPPQKPPCPQVSTSHSNSKRASSHLARPSAPATGRRHLIHRLLPRLIASLGLVLGRCTSYISFHSLMDTHTHILTYTFYRQYNFMICQDILNHLKCASHFQQPKAKTSTEPFTYHWHFRFTHPAAVLTACFGSTTNVGFSAGLDKRIRRWAGSHSDWFVIHCLKQGLMRVVKVGFWYWSCPSIGQARWCCPKYRLVSSIQ